MKSVSVFLKREPFAQNLIYQRNVCVGCPYCTNKPGRRKNFKNLFRLYMHFRTHHSSEPNHKEIVMTLADLMIRGVLL
jgi:hypothetical protein